MLSNFVVLVDGQHVVFNIYLSVFSLRNAHLGTGVVLQLTETVFGLFYLLKGFLCVILLLNGHRSQLRRALFVEPIVLFSVVVGLVYICSRYVPRHFSILQFNYS